MRPMLLAAKPKTCEQLTSEGKRSKPESLLVVLDVMIGVGSEDSELENAKMVASLPGWKPY